jgi:hypothetical protein
MTTGKVATPELVEAMRPLEPPLSCSPAVYPTAVTMPSIGAVSVAPASALLALSA